jgi:hypothetical protein
VAEDTSAVAGLNVRIEVLRYADLIPVVLNARYMTHETFQRLVANIRRDGHPTQIPFAWLNRERGGYEVLSGNHRRDATLEALGGEYAGPVLVTDDELSKERRTAIQLSHNSIAGDDDPAILRELYASVGEIDWKLYSALDDKTLDLLDQVLVEGLGEVNLDYTMVTLLFLPNEVAEVSRVFAEARAAVPADTVWLAAMADYDRLLDSLQVIGTAHEVRNQALALRLLLDLAEQHLGELAPATKPREKTPSKNASGSPNATAAKGSAGRS